ncbi:MAG: UbiX family flavin prenyltransferase [Bacillota bacterium]
MQLIVAITGTTGVIYGIRLLEAIRNTECKSHLIISPWGEKNIELETEYTAAQVKALADYTHDYNNLGSSISSGSFPVDGMAVIPCSMKSLSAMAHGYTNNLINRAADVTLKEKRKLVVVPRETPLNLIHLNNMTALCQAGAVILPPMPAFYHKPKTINDLVNQTVGKVLDQFKISHNLFERWHGMEGGDQ